MSRLYGYVDGRSSTLATRCGDQHIASRVKSWDFSIRVDMWDDETARVVAHDIETGKEVSLFTGSLESLFRREVPNRDRYGQVKPPKPAKVPKLTKAQQKALQLQQQLIASLFGEDDETGSAGNSASIA